MGQETGDKGQKVDETVRRGNGDAESCALLAQAILWFSLFLVLAALVAVKWQPLVALDISLLRTINKGLATDWLDGTMLLFFPFGKLAFNLVAPCPLAWILVMVQKPNLSANRESSGNVGWLDFGCGNRSWNCRRS
jgi:undecaprenyl-diphosphatase